MIDATNETLVHLTSQARTLPGSPSYETLFRWWKQGYPAGDKSIRLEVVKLGNAPYTSVEAFQRFVEAVNEAKHVRCPR